MDLVAVNKDCLDKVCEGIVLFHTFYVYFYSILWIICIILLIGIINSYYKMLQGINEYV